MILSETSLACKTRRPIDHVKFGDADRDVVLRASFAEEILVDPRVATWRRKLALQRIRLRELVLESIIARM